MSKFYTRTSGLFLLFFAALSMAGITQQTPDYTLLLNSGKFVPEENISRIRKESAEMTGSFFGGKNYLTLQFRSLPTPAEKQKMEAVGILLMDYIPNLAYTAVVNSSVSVEQLKSFPLRSVFPFTAAQKTVPALLSGQVPAHAIKQAGYADLTVITYETMPIGKIAGSLFPLQVSILEDMPMFRSFTLRVPQANMQQVAALPFIQWVEFIDVPNQLENTLGRTLHRVNTLNDGPRNLKGDGLNIGIWDEGEISPHLDFSPAGRLNQMEFSSPSQHSTHCAGTILGRGLINQTARGMAPNARLYSYNFSGNIQSEMAAAIPANNLVVSSHSYGGSATCGVNGSGVVYSSTSRATDINLNTFPYHLHVHSAGNSQTACSGGWSTITGSGKTAKNNILVANITTAEALSGSSSCGPVQDGRVKPEISAFGTSVFSTSTPLNAYATLSGTSMATPGVAGSVSLLVQRYKQLNGDNLPPSTLIKNTVLNTAHDLGNPGPDYRFGYGRIDALKAIRILEDNRYVVNTIGTGTANDITITVPEGAARLRVMLTWNDPAGAANANPALVNNLDLTVINGPTTSLPWILDPLNPSNAATNGVDNVSNIEQVELNFPAAGTYTLRVAGTAVPVGASQEYALTWNIDQPYIEVTYPNGGESFSPGSNETITWDNAGISGTQTVEYSVNGGATWNLISSSVSGFTTRLVWSVPAGVNTSTALIRVTSGSVSDQSDATFKILGTVSGFSANGTSCNAGEVNFTWTAVANATHYDIYRLDAASGQFVLHAGNITGTSYTATGLTPNTSMWFTIRSKNSSTGAESERSNAVNVTVSNGGGGLGAVGAISGQNTVCGNPSNVVYSVSPVTGATSYTWTAPPGAGIVSGQGTTSVTISFGAGSSSGNISVFASNGACNTAPATKSIIVGSTSVAAPASGGNQTQVVCGNNTLPVLTATASVAPGFTITWYDAATGGNTVANPVWNTAGSVTYYAASKDNGTGCESNQRTAVTLTITVVPDVTVSASGSTQFCQGGNVILTASNAASWNWSNGATTQSITVTNSGNYTVTVSNNGCASTSTAVGVTVNPLPQPVITAGGPTSFCEGGSVTLNAGSHSFYNWSNGATSQNITVNNSGNFTVTVTNEEGCSATSAVTVVSVSPSPQVSISTAPYQNLYPGLNTTLSAQVNPAGNYNYSWRRNGNSTGGNTANLSGIGIEQTGSYTVTVTNTTGLPCTNTSSALVIGDSAMYRLFILPNPADGEFEVVYYSAGNNQYTLSISDAKGATVFRKAYSISGPYQRMPVDMRQANKGIYQVVLTDRSGKKLAAGKVLIH